MTESSAEPAYRRLGPEAPASPLVISVPHAGRLYSQSLLASARLSLEALESLEDRFVDRLIWRAVADGATAIVADAPRAEIDLNRDEREVEPGTVVPAPATASLLQSARSRGGLGLIPSRIAGLGSIWLRPIPTAELERRIVRIHRPYHAALERELEAARARFGIAILLDCHSMPPRAPEAGQGPVIFGDRHGSSIAADLLEAAMAATQAAGFPPSRNAPYAGGYITARHGRPKEGFHALQIEIDRALYLDRELRAPGPGFDKVCRLIASVARALAARAVEPPAIAAE